MVITTEKDQEKDQFTTLRSIVEELMKDTEYDRDSTRRKLLKRWRDDEEINTMLMEWAADVLIEDVIRRRRNKVFRGIATEETPQSDADRKASVAYANMLLDQEVRPGLLLRNATKKDLLEKIKELRSHAHGVLRHAFYLETVSRRLRGNEKVGDVITDADLKQIMVLAEKKVKQMV